MTATQIMHEIERLPAIEKAKVVRYVRDMPGDGAPLSGAQLTSLAQQMVDAPTPAESQRLKTALVNGFFGGD